MSEYCFQIVLPSIQKFYKSDVVNEAYDDGEAGDDDDVVQAMEGALVVGLVVWKCQCSMHEQQHSECSKKFY